MRFNISLGCRIALSFLLLGATLATTTAAPRSVSDIDRIVVIVNDDVITQTELAQRLRETKKQLEVEKIAAPPDPVLRKQLLDRMVLERLQLQLATQIGIQASESDVDRVFENLARRNNLDNEEFRRALVQQGLDIAAFRSQLREQIAIQQLLEREISNRVIVTDAEVENFLDNPQNRAGIDTSFQLSHILIGIPESASPEAIQSARQRAEEVHRLLSQGASFEQTAVSYSQGSDALRGGNLGWKKPGELPELFLDSLKKLKPGEISEVLRSPNGFHVLKLNEKRGSVPVESVTQTHVRHILVRPSEIQSMDEARTKLLALRERIENGEDFTVLARANSEDAASAATGGDLGWTNPGQMVPEFEQAMKALEPNQVSQPVRTPFGLHLIQVLGRRNHDITQEREIAAARSQIHARKADERFEQWVRQLRNEAYVEYLIEDVN